VTGFEYTIIIWTTDTFLESVVFSAVIPPPLTGQKSLAQFSSRMRGFQKQWQTLQEDQKDDVKKS